MISIDLPFNIPTFTVDKEGLLEKFYAIAGRKDINFENHPDFSKRFYLVGKRPE